MVAANITQLLATYITALHILHFHGILDGYGHMSLRNPENSSTFYMFHRGAPALVSSLDDIALYRVSDAEPVEPNGPAGFLERFIHSEVLKRYPGINVVLHGHPDVLVSYSIIDAPLRAAIHMAGYLGASIDAMPQMMTPITANITTTAVPLTPIPHRPTNPRLRHQPALPPERHPRPARQQGAPRGCARGGVLGRRRRRRHPRGAGAARPRAGPDAEPRLHQLRRRARDGRVPGHLRQDQRRRRVRGAEDPARLHGLGRWWRSWRCVSDTAAGARYVGDDWPGRVEALGLMEEASAGRSAVR